MKKIKKELEAELAGRAVITVGKSRIILVEERAYNQLGKEILVIRGELY